MIDVAILGWTCVLLLSFIRVYLIRNTRAFPAVPLPHPMDTVPVELWHLVTSYLDPSSIACLALSCRMFLNLFGNGPLRRLADPNLQAERINFFFRYLDGALPKHVLCHSCARFHKRDSMHVRLMSICGGCSNSFRTERSFSTGTDLIDREYLSWAEVQSAAREARYGPKFGRALPSFSNKTGVDGWQHSMQSRLVDNHFIFRYESFKEFSWPGSEEVLRANLHVPTPPSCFHFRTNLESMIRCARRHVFSSSSVSSSSSPLLSEGEEASALSLCSYCSNLRRCLICASEYLISIESVAGKGEATHALRISRWTDLGDGFNPRHRFWWGACKIDCRNELEVFGLAGLATVRSRFETSIGYDVPDQIIRPSEYRYR